MNKRVFKVISAAATGLFLVILTGHTALAEDTIEKGIYAGSIDIGGMSEQEATDAVESYTQSIKDSVITLNAVGGNSAEVTLSEIDLKWSNKDIITEALDIGKKGNLVSRYKQIKDLQKQNRVFPIEFSVDDELVKSVLSERCSIYDIPAIDGGLQRVNGSFEVTGGTVGQMVDIEASASDLEYFIAKQWDGSSTAYDLSIVTDDPNGTVEELSLVKDVLGSYHTSFKTSSASRSSNIRNGASLINGSVIYPGEEFSFYNHVKPFTFDNGYQVAAAYSSGQVVDSVGGGICQVSSTLYNSVLLSELEVTERRNHGMIVTYVDPARDATIAESAGTDFRFVNNTDAPIYLDAYTTDDKQLFINIYGHETRPADRELSYESEVVSKTVPENIVVTRDGSHPVGYVSVQAAHVGYKANLWKVVTQNGETTRELVNTSVYNPAPKYVTVGTGTGDPNISAALESAIETNDVDTIKAMAAQCKAMDEANAAAAAAIAMIPADGGEAPAVTP